MRIVHGDGDAEREVRLRIGRPDATVADLAVALGEPGRELSIDGRVVLPEAGLGECGLLHGSRVVRTDRVPFARKPPAVLRLTGGLEAGRVVPLRTGRTVLGRGSEAEVRIAATGVSRCHAELEVRRDGSVTVADSGSANGTDVNNVRISGTVPVGPEDLVSFGGEVLARILPSDRLGTVQNLNPVREAGPGGTMPFNRSPRGGGAAGQPELRAPAALAERDKPPFSVSTMLGPLLIGVVMAVASDIRYALIALLTPVMFVANFFEERLRGRFRLRRGAREHAAHLARFRQEVRERRAAEVHRRRAAHPDPAEVVHRATAPGLRLWERRADAPDFLQVMAGTADLRWTPPVETGSSPMAPEAAEFLAQLDALPQVPVVVGVRAGEAVGFEGNRTSALAVARALLCQAVVDSGPADVTVAVFTDPGRLHDWDWTKWLPHGADPRSGEARLVAVGHEPAQELAKDLLAGSRSVDGKRRERPVLLAVVDGAALLEGRPCPLRDLLAGVGGPCGALVLTDRLPALCTTVVTATADGNGRVREVATGEVVERVLLSGVRVAEARETARGLARFEDPELRIEGAGLPDRIPLLPLLDLDEVSGPAVGDHWQKRAPELRVKAVLGVSERDLFTVDLDDDGPHALIAGTTGSGKSELLRTMIASMAVDADPEHLTFALVDYKGGGALDECAELPHTVGLVTDLDEQLGERALRCLDAEVRHRERLLREVGLSHVRDYQRLRDTGRGDLEPMPRLVVVIDEFATLVKALPDFVDALVSIAQRGRTLGVHLVLATQRPAGSVNDAIKNNVKLRIALRLESTGDSQDVIDRPDAAGIGTRQWGRAYYRLSAREVLPVQTALSTGVTPRAAVTAPVTAEPLVLGVPDGGPAAVAEDGPTDLRRLVTAAREAAARAGFATPRRPWPDPLPAVVPAAELPPLAERGLQTDAAGLPAHALADDPDRQRQYPVGWDPAAGNLLVYGAGGSGTSTALVALALATAGARPPHRCHLFALDLGAGDLAPLTGLPHTGAHIGAAERERQIRLIKLLRRELDDRKAHGPGREPDWLVLIDNLGALLADFDKDLAGTNLIEELARVYADGPAVGIHFAVSADRSGAVPSAWSALTQQKLLMRLADPGEYSYFDVPRTSVPGFVPGRALVAATRQVVQIAWPGEDLGAAVATAAARWRGAPATAPRIDVLPTDVLAEDLAAPAEVGAEPWWLPMGLDAETLKGTGVRLYEREHALIAGPQRSGRSSALCALARLALATPGVPPAVVAFAPRRSPLRDLPAPAVVVTDYDRLEAALGARTGPVLLLVDDADTVEDPLGVLERWASGAGPGHHLVAAGRGDALRRLFGHWTQHARDSRCGVLLVPDHDLDGDLLGATLPRHDRVAPLPGRGYLVADGVARGVQLAR
ncbi:FtsK/SpoIIIE domain-containing protein [Streptomyces sp. NPDC001657]|uniref:FtsK/SpoIIIE domain-containing protein n=1 Tax=Streptomyces sp. NPDC001657 TaxID=3154522 RepID=UPI00331B14BF